MNKKFCSVCLILIFICIAAMLLSCKRKTTIKEDLSQMEDKAISEVQKLRFGQMPDGQNIDLYVLTSTSGIKARIMTYGATLVSMEVPDREGNPSDITLGHDSIDGYIGDSPYFGSTVGRYANRIAKGKFTLGGLDYILAQNNGENHLHGGIKGFDKVIWSAEPIRIEGAVGVKFVYFSRDGEEGYPGNLTCTVTYLLTDKDELKISYEAETDKPTHVNLTHHSYFNLAGQGSRDILSHELMLNADKYTPVDEGLIPTGEVRSVADSPMDFTTPHTIGERIDQVGISWTVRSQENQARFIISTMGFAWSRSIFRILPTSPTFHPPSSIQVRNTRA